MLLAAYSAHAQTYTYSVLYTFTGAADGGNPYSSLYRDPAGDLYATTLNDGGASGCGTVVETLFSTTLPWTEKPLHTFAGKPDDGCNPYGGLVVDKKGNLYGTTYAGGTDSLGTVFELTPPAKKKGSWTYNVIYNFAGAPKDGANPEDGLVLDSNGNLYGTTVGGGADGDGAAFELSPSATGFTESMLYSFKGKPDGTDPYAGLQLDAKDNAYGVTAAGGANGQGMVFELTPSDGVWTETPLYSFCPVTGCKDGGWPSGTLVVEGGYYGTTQAGGAHGDGTVFEFLKAKSKEVVLYSFQGKPDGSTPVAGLAGGTKGVYYGTTSAGGANNNNGMVFALTPEPSGGCPSGSNQGDFYCETNLYSFCSQASCSDGAVPIAALIQDAKGNLYGTTKQGGNTACGGSGCGVVFKLTPSTSE